MIAIRRFGLIIAILLIGLLIGKLGSFAAIVVFSGLFIIWFMLWDEHTYARQHPTKPYMKEDRYYEYPSSRFHKSL